MPRETIKIPISEDGVPFEAASMLLSYIAYPENPSRGAFSAALCRHAHLERGSRDKQWRNSPQKIRPWIFSFEEKVMFSSLTKGSNTLRRRLITASLMLFPHLNALLTGRSPLKIDGFEPTVENVSLYLMQILKYSDESVSTFKSKIWGPTKPVAHLAFSFAQLVFFPRTIEYNIKFPGKGLSMLECLLPFPPDETLREVLTHAEIIRLALPKIKQFRITEEQTIKFIAV